MSTLLFSSIDMKDHGSVYPMTDDILGLRLYCSRDLHDFGCRREGDWIWLVGSGGCWTTGPRVMSPCSSKLLSSFWIAFPSSWLYYYLPSPSGWARATPYCHDLPSLKLTLPHLPSLLPSIVSPYRPPALPIPPWENAPPGLLSLSSRDLLLKAQ